ncbi:GrpB family protein [Bifidobacterium sp. ESL0732]|uniref:GrpB family protein n=1 Tax=Bifidobacterium sp. ESL0732 TaxID=2983222 RepID=UPI0023FA1B5B|nr:GrpB family protein [Bifidobacterium sp. ESL0732]WEV63367.1 GrpB family protein [Bifidobacterium sp. ESL0732]
MRDKRRNDVGDDSGGQWSSAAFRKAIVAFDDAPAPQGESPFIEGVEPRRDVAVVSYDPSWPLLFDRLRATIVHALGFRALAIEHIGSTSVPGLAAKPVIDIDLTVADSGDEQTYAPALEKLGFHLIIREPWWYEHRMLRSDDPACNLHVWSVGSPEAMRHLIFRNWLRHNAKDRNLYISVKREAANHTHTSMVSDYNQRKQDTIRSIYARAFAAAGFIDSQALQ